LKDISTMFFLCYFAWRCCPGKFDVATALGPWGAIPGIALRKMQRVRSLVYEDRDYEPGFIRTPLRRRWASWLERVAMREADQVIAIGGRLANLRRQQTGRAIDIVPTGVDLARFARVERSEPRPVLIYTGNMAAWSGLDVVLKAMPRIRLDIPAIQCVFVGSGLPNVREHLEQLADGLGIREAVQFAGQVPYERVNSYLAEAGIGLALFQPTELRQYAAPLKVLEYMAAGLPTIATHHSEAADLLAAEDCGLASDFNADAFAGAVLSLLRDDQSYGRMSANARRSAERFDWSKLMTDEYNLLDAAWRRGRTKT